MASAAETALNIGRNQASVIEAAFRNNMAVMQNISDSNARVSGIYRDMLGAAVADRKQRADEYLGIERIRLEGEANDIRAKQVAGDLALGEQRLAAYNRSIDIRNAEIEARKEAMDKTKKYAPYIRNLTGMAAREDLAIKNDMATVDKNLTILQKQYDDMTTAQKLLKGKAIQDQITGLINKRYELNQRTGKIDLIRAEIDTVTQGGEPGQFFKASDLPGLKPGEEATINPMLLPNADGTPRVNPGIRSIDPLLQGGGSDAEINLNDPLGLDDEFETELISPEDAGSDSSAEDEAAIQGNPNIRFGQIPAQTFNAPIPDGQQPEREYIPRDIGMGVLRDPKTTYSDAVEIIANMSPKDQKFITVDVRNGIETDFLEFLGVSKDYNPMNKTEDVNEYMKNLMTNYERTGVPNIEAYAKINGLQAEAESKLREFRIEGMKNNLGVGDANEDKLTNFVAKEYRAWIADRLKTAEDSKKAAESTDITKGNAIVADGKINLGGIPLVPGSSIDVPIDTTTSPTERARAMTSASRSTEQSRFDRVAYQKSIEQGEADAATTNKEIEDFRKQFVIQTGENRGKLRESLRTFITNNAGYLPNMPTLGEYESPDSYYQRLDARINEISSSYTSAMNAWREILRRNPNAKINKR